MEGEHPIGLIPSPPTFDVNYVFLFLFLERGMQRPHTGIPNEAFSDFEPFVFATGA